MCGIYSVILGHSNVKESLLRKDETPALDDCQCSLGRRKLKKHGVVGKREVIHKGVRAAAERVLKLKPYGACAFQKNPFSPGESG